MVNYQTHLDKILSSSTEINIWRDGVISEKHYFSEDNTIKILFILRETVDLYNREDILLNYLRDGGYYRGTAPMITRLTQLIYKWNDDQQINLSLINGQKHNRIAYLNKIAWVNLKKSPNTKSIYTDWNNFEQIAIDNAELIRKQIELCSPDIIVCGGNYGILTNYVLEDDFKNNEVIVQNGFNYSILHDIPIIDCYHPSHRNTKNFMTKFLLTLNSIKPFKTNPFM
ncbi:MAG: hypothetical protein E6X35_07095 [Enterococcus gallinarum]|nr:hypothetical protein [Enterococcus gallinarum]MDU4932020.1 hypothetical protein [Enterococcus gallinarum]